MKYTYDVCTYTNQTGLLQASRVATTTNLNEITINEVTKPFFVRVIDNFTHMLHKSLNSPDDLESWRIAQERAAAWAPEKFKTTVQEPGKKASMEELTSQKENIKPIHYQNYIEEFEWIDAMSRIPRYKDPIAFKAAIELQIRKYLDRNGRKDAELQELKKGLFYYMYLVMYLKNHCKPILAKDVHKIMEAFK